MNTATQPMITAETFQVPELDRTALPYIQQRIDQKTKPPGALGQLETLASQLALILGQSSFVKSSFEQSSVEESSQGTSSQQQSSHASSVSTLTTQPDRIDSIKPALLVFAGDHGIAEEGISIAPSAVTQQMVVNFLNGGAAINCFCRSFDIALTVIDAGLLLPVQYPQLVQQSLGRGTHNFTRQAAMSMQQVVSGMLRGRDIAYKHIEQNNNVLAFGEMGIGNTSSASAIMAALLKLPVNQCVGRGTGIDDTAFNKKTQLIEQALHLHRDQLECPLDIMASVGGFEIVQMVGAMLGTAEKERVILVDGFIATAAAMLAVGICPAAKAYMVFCHQSNEQGHQRMLQHLDATSLLSLDLRLGEGTGAALAIPLLRAAVAFYNDMASFESAGVEAV